MSKCRLCGLEKPLRKSHIIPKFVSQYIKENSLTGYLRQSGNINQRVQDGLKVSLLCQDCELKFSKWEREFAKIFFHHNKLAKEGKQALVKIVYDSSLISFVVSLFWRSIVATKITEHISPENLLRIKELEKQWLEFLNGERKNWGKCEFYLVLFDYIDPEYLSSLPQYFDAYLFNLLEICPYETKDKLGFFIKLPGMLLLCSIIPSKLPGMKGIKIKNRGKLFPENIKYKSPIIGQIIMARSEATGNIFNREISQKQHNKIVDDIIKNLLLPKK
ncbi:MAG: hypothetical protein WC895_02735 [Candidatus Shapirobacteria bacterium]